MIDENEEDNLNETIGCIADYQFSEYLKEDDEYNLEDEDISIKTEKNISLEYKKDLEKNFEEQKKDLIKKCEDEHNYSQNSEDEMENEQNSQALDNSELQPYENLIGTRENLLIFDKIAWDYIVQVYQLCDKKLKMKKEFQFYSKEERLNLIESLKTQKMLNLREQVQQALNEKLKSGIKFDEKDNWNLQKNSESLKRLPAEEKKIKEAEYLKKQAQYFKEIQEVLKKEIIQRNRQTIEELSKWETQKKKALPTKAQDTAEYGFERIVDVEMYKHDLLNLIQNYMIITQDQKNIFRMSFQTLLDKKALQFIIQNDAGTGKSFLLKDLQNRFFYQNVQVLASTGSAAMALGGTTVHNFFNIGGNPKFVHKLQPNTEYYYRILNTDFDEFSMLNSETILNANKKMKEVLIDKIPTNHCTETMKKLPLFCVKDVIMIGDALKLPPVLKKGDRLHDIVESGIFRTLPMYTLEQNVRQSSETQLQKILKEVRTANKTLTIEVQNLLEQQVCDKVGCNILETDEDLLILCSKRYKRDEYNRQRFQKFNKSKDHFRLEPLILLEMGQNLEPISDGTLLYNTVIAQFTQETNLNKFLTVAQGAPVIITTNIFDQNNKLLYANGTRCKIGFQSAEQDFITLEHTIINHSTKKSEQEVFKLKRQQYSISVYSKKYLIRAYPIEIAYAMTIHKAQGCTLDKVLIDFADFFAAGQAYTALSRCKTHENIHILNLDFTKFTSSTVKRQFIQDKLEESDIQGKLKD